MSAFIVSKAHIDALVRTIIDGPESAKPQNWHLYVFHNGIGRTVKWEDADSVGASLWGENLKSVAARYPGNGDGGRPGAGDTDAEIAAYTYPIDNQPARLNVGAALKALDCLEYQSCEHAGWEDSEAHAILKYLRGALGTVTPGYREAPWGID